MAPRPLSPVSLSCASSAANIPARKRPRRSDRLRHSKRPRTTPPSERLEDIVVRNVLTSPTSVNPGFLHTAHNDDIDAHVREIAVDWLMEVAAEYEARSQTLALAVNYMDRVLERISIDRNNLQLLAVVCMLIACKIEETEPPSVADVMFICDNTYTKQQVHQMETRVLVQLDFRLTYPTHFSVVGYISRAMRCSSSRVTHIAQFAAHVALLDAQLAAESAGVVAMGCILVAMRIEALDATCLDDCPNSVVEKCGKEAGLAALRVFEMWCKLHRRHHAGQSRWLFIRWPKVAELFEAVADGGGSEKTQKRMLKTR